MSMRDWLDFSRETFRGKTLGRILLNQALRREIRTLRGRVLDVAGGMSSYDRYVDTRDAEVIATNLDTTRTGGTPHDFHEPFPFPDASFDEALFMNAIYVARNPGLVFQNVSRILKPGGRFTVASPFIFPEYPDPNDYGRPASQGLRFLAEEQGFAVERLVSLGGRASAAEYLVDDAFLIAPIKLLARALALLADAWIFRRLERLKPAPITWLLIARKV